MVTKKKKDLIPLAMYQIMFGKYAALRALEKELEEHLEQNYIFKKEFETGWDFQSLIGDSLYQEDDVEEFLKDLKIKTTRK